ncbi:MAG: putative transporter small subunit [Cryobacterium sp.]
MHTVLMTVYVLVWPAMVVGVLYVLCAGVYRDYRAAKKEGRSLV